MISVSDAFLARMQEGYRIYEYKVDITLADGTVLDTITPAKIWAGGLDYEDAVTAQNQLQIGAAIINALTLRIDNTDETYSSMEFDGADMVLQVGLDLGGGNIEWHQRGRYTVDAASGQNSYSVELSCLDYMEKFDRPYSESTLEYPATLLQILQDACTVCGVPLATTDFDASGYTVQERPDDSSMTFRDIISCAAAIACKWARMTPAGTLELGWYNLRNPYAILGANEAGVMTAGEAFVLVNGSAPFPVSLGAVAQQDISTSDIRVTGIYVKSYVTDEEGEDDYQAGEDGYILSITENPLIQAGEAETVAGMIWEATKGLAYRPLSVSVLADPVLQAGDMVYVTDYKGRGYVTYASIINFSAGSYLRVQATAETVGKVKSTQFSATSKAMAKVEARVEAEVEERKAAIQGLTDRVTQSGGLFMTTVTQSDGSTVYYLHNREALEDSNIIWIMTEQAIAVSTDGGRTYPYGFSVDGSVVVQTLEAEGVSADWIKSGVLQVDGNDGETVFSADCDSGTVYFKDAEYRPGDSQDPVSVPVHGILEAGRTRVRFLVPMDKLVDETAVLGIDDESTFKVLQAGTYLIGSASAGAPFSDYTVTCTRTWAGMVVTVTSSSALSGTNNSAVMVDLFDFAFTYGYEGGDE